MSVTWSSTDPRTGQRVLYGPEETAQLEAAFTGQQRNCELNVSFKYTLITRLL
jgi:hypothetical protein